MKDMQIITNPGGTAAGANAEYLNAAESMHVEEQTPLEIAEELLDKRRFAKVMAMTAQRFVLLTPTEKRNYLRWAKHFRKVFSEKESLFERHTPADIDTPTFLQVRPLP